MIKRVLDSALRAREYWSQHREIVLRVLTHNIMILSSNVFYRAVLTRFLPLSPSNRRRRRILSLFLCVRTNHTHLARRCQRTW